MALQKEVTVIAVTTRNGIGWNAEMNLTCWPDGVVKEYPVLNADGIIDMKNAILCQDFTGLIKSQVEGLTQDVLINRLTTEIQPQMQEIIDDYIAKDSIETGATLEAVRATIEGGLKG